MGKGSGFFLVQSVSLCSCSCSTWLGYVTPRGPRPQQVSVAASSPLGPPAGSPDNSAPLQRCLASFAGASAEFPALASQLAPLGKTPWFPSVPEASWSLVGHSHILSHKIRNSLGCRGEARGSSFKFVPSMGILSQLQVQPQLSLYLLFLYSLVANPITKL